LLNLGRGGCSVLGNSEQLVHHPLALDAVQRPVAAGRQRLDYPGEHVLGCDTVVFHKAEQIAV
jgi:hypothetical protein